ncbi:hypothetical protein [Levilactobacillus cerevisiae]|uniref:hypothetical protein n=1 Tax=Levilactobacillus cerevisiae TaxID=1704076 RepID=UPI000F769423|nr:hypothetical protein [Levilactobacillus cerevisiae]
MKKVLALAVVSLSVGLPLAMNTPTTAHAAKWHQGTPKVLRGTWERKVTVGKGTKWAYKAWDGVKITKSGLNAYYVGDPFVLGKIKHQKISKHDYMLRGIEMVNSLRPYRVRVHQVGKRLKYVEYYDTGAGHYSQMGKLGAWLPKK